MKSSLVAAFFLSTSTLFAGTGDADIDNFLTEVKAASKAQIETIFQQKGNGLQDRICRKVNTINAVGELGDLSIGVMKWPSLKQICASHKFTTTEGAAAAPQVSALTEARKKMQDNAAGTGFESYKASAASKVDTSAFTRNEREEGLKVALSKKEASFRKGLEAAASQHKERREQLLHQAKLNHAHVVAKLSLEEHESRLRAEDAEKQMAEMEKKLQEMRQVLARVEHGDNALKVLGEEKAREETERKALKEDFDLKTKALQEHIQRQEVESLALRTRLETADNEAAAYRAALEKLQAGKSLLEGISTVKVEMMRQQEEDRRSSEQNEARLRAALVEAHQKRLQLAVELSVLQQKMRALTKTEETRRGQAQFQESQAREEMVRGFTGQTRALEDRLRAEAERIQMIQRQNAERMTKEQTAALQKVQTELAEATTLVGNLHEAAYVFATEIGAISEGARQTVQALLRAIEKREVHHGDKNIKERQLDGLRQQYAAADQQVRELTVASRKLTDDLQGTAAAD